MTPVEQTLADALEFFQSGKIDEATPLLEKVLKVDGQNVPALHHLAIVAASRRDWEGARLLLERALAVSPDLTDARESLLKILVTEEKWTDALAQADILMAQNPERSIAFEMAAWIHRRLDQFGQARPLLEKALALNPERADLAKALAGLKPDGSGWEEPWPTIKYQETDPKQLAAQYDKYWRNSPSTAPTVKLAKSLGALHDPGAMTDRDMPSLPPLPVNAFSAVPQPPARGEDVRGLSVLFGPQAIAGVAPRMARWLNQHGATAHTIEYFPTFLDYQADFKNPDPSPAGLAKFSDLMLEKARNYDVICLDFAASFKYLPQWNLDLRTHRDLDQPYADLIPLKEMGKKIFCFFWGSDCFGQALNHSAYLRFLDIEDLPKPPNHTRLQAVNIRALDKLADAFIAFPFFAGGLPRVSPYWDLPFDPELWPAKAGYSDRVTNILTAPTSLRKKNFDLMESALKSLTGRHPDLRPYSVQNRPFREVPALYAKADLGLEQATFGFGLLAVEMMALGLPVIANFHALNRESFSRSAAPLLSYSNIRGLYDRLEECVADPRGLAARGRLGRDYAMTFHTTDVMGRALSRYLAQARSGEAVDQLTGMAQYKYMSQCWLQEPEQVWRFKYFDVGVPLLCALGKYEMAAIDCHEAVECGYRTQKFTAWRQALLVAADSGPLAAASARRRFREGGQSAELKMFEHYLEMLSSSQKLLDEADRGIKEAVDLQARLKAAGEWPAWLG